MGVLNFHLPDGLIYFVNFACTPSTFSDMDVNVDSGPLLAIEKSALPLGSDRLSPAYRGTSLKRNTHPLGST